jgi:hypothetical protein
LFGVEVNTINYHLKEIFSTGELTEEATIRKIRTVQTEGNRQVERERAFYNLDAIISVGYRVNSQRATHFRQWATRVLNEFIRKGFVLDDDRLKQGYDIFNKTQRIDSDFDKRIRGMLSGKNSNDKECNLRFSSTNQHQAQHRRGSRGSVKHDT